MRLSVFLALILLIACSPRDTVEQLLDPQEVIDPGKGIPGSSALGSAVPDSRNKATILAYFDELIANGQILAGQQCGDHPDLTNDYYQAYVARLAGKTNKYVGVVGAEFGNFSGGNYPVKTLVQHWDEGGLVTVSWHAGNPFEQEIDGFGIDAKNDLPINLTALLKDAPESYIKSAYRKEVDAMAGALQHLQDAGVTVIWRPFPDMNGDQEWWGIQPSQDQQTTISNFKMLWRDLYDTLTYDYGLDNLIWTYSVMPSRESKAPVTACYPGSDYVDLAGMDYYGKTPCFPDFSSLRSLGKTLVVSETGPSPDATRRWDELRLITALSGKAAYFLQWHSFPGEALAIQDNLKANDLMNSEKVVTRDEIGILPLD